MIESRFWRQELRTDLAWLRKHKFYRRWSEKQQVLYERRLMLVAFQIRSLLERPKVAREYAMKELSVVRYRKKSEKPFTRIDYAVDEYFDVEAPQPCKLRALQLCNQLIHYYLMFIWGHRNYETLFVFSDFKRHECLFEINVEELLDYFAQFGREDSALSSTRSKVALKWNAEKQDYEYEESAA